MIYQILRIIAMGLLRSIWQLKVEGAENIPKKGAFILASNHASFLDAPSLAAAFPRKIYWVARRELFNAWGLKWVLMLCNCIPVNGATKEARKIIAEEKVLGIFPEGARTWEGKLQEGKKGIAVLSLKTGTPILPVAIIGSFQAYPRTKKFPRVYPINVRFGKPISFGITDKDVIDENILKDVSGQIMAKISELM